jgi:aminomethyltransferase
MPAALLRTPLSDRHVAAGAKVGPFAGWEMPLYYTTVREEHRAVRERAGLFDVSHMGQLEVSGAGARPWLQSMLTNDLNRVGPGQGQYTLLLQDDGGIIDDLIVYGLPDRFLLVVNASNVVACHDWLSDHAPADAEVNDRSLEIGMLALQGPSWRQALEPLAASPAPFELEYFEIAEDAVAGVPCLVARTGYTGEPGVEMLCPWDGTQRVWDALMEGSHAPAPVGLAARDTLRLEMGYPLYGQDLSRERTPIEAGLAWACDLPEGGFTGAEVLRRQAEDGTAERLGIFRLTEPGIPRAGNEVLAGGRHAGRVTSGTLSPTLGAGIGMAYLDAETARPGHEIEIDVRGRPKAARTERRPLVPRSPKDDSKGGS